MTKSKKAPRIISAALAIVMLLSFAACSGNKNEPEKVKLTNVYKSEVVGLPKGVQYIERMCVTTDNIFFSGSSYDEETGQHSAGLFVMKHDGTEQSQIYSYEDESDYEKQIYKSKNIQNMAVDNDGALWVVETESYDDYSNPDNYVSERKNTVKKIDLSGNTLLEIDVKEIEPDSEYIYLDYLCFDSTGSLYFSTGNNVYAVDTQTGKVAFKLEEPNYVNSLSRSGSGDVYATTWGENGNVIKKIDSAKKAWGETFTTNNYNIYNLIPGSGEYDFYYQSEMGMFGYILATQESVEVINWLNSDINSSRINSLTPLADGRILTIQYSEDYSAPELTMLTKKPDSEIKEAIMITYATMWLGSDFRSAILKFNRSQEEYRIQVLDYSQYNNYETDDGWRAGYEKLNMDIISGNIPDIINLEGLQANNYISKGLLADLYKFIDEDPELKREDLLENVLEAGSQNGKLYQLFPSFSIQTIAAKTSIVGNTPGWTMDDLLSLINRMEGASAFSPEMTKADILNYCTIMTMSQFINYDTGECKFDSPEFIKLLEFANSFPEEIDWDALYGQEDYWQMRQDAYKEDRTLLMQCYIYGVRAIRDYKEQFGAPITFIGFPTASGTGSCIMPEMQLAISARSKNQDAAWQFLRQFITEDYYSGRNYYGSLPLNKKVLEKNIELEKTPWEDREEQSGGGMIVYDRAISVGTTGIAIGGNGNTDYDDYYKNYHLTEEEADQLMSLITSVNQLYYNDTDVTKIITEETQDFFKNAKSAGAVADIIQNKIQTYINESR